MGLAEDKLFEYLRNNLSIMKSINVDDMLDSLRGVFTIGTAEQLDRHLDRRGNTRTVYNFLNDLRGRDNWVNHLLRALWECGYHELYYRLRDVYRSYKPRSVWEPDDPFSSLPQPPNHYQPSQPDNQPRCTSVPLPQPGPAVAAPPSAVRPQQGPIKTDQSQETIEPSVLPRAPTSKSPQSAPVSLPDEVDSGTASDFISKTPVPESSSFISEPGVESDGVLSQTTNPSEQYLSVASSLPARNDIAATQPRQEMPENQEALHSVEQRIPVVNTLRKDPELPYTPRHQEMDGSDVSNPSSSPASSIRAVNEAWTPQPGHSQGTCIPPEGQRNEANDTSVRHSAEPVSNPVTSSPSQRLLELSLDTGTSAGLGHQRSEQTTNQPAVHRSSCRPTEHITFGIDKPGVLMSSGGFVDATGGANEVVPLSREPSFEISTDDSSNGRSQSSGSPQQPIARAINRSPTPQEVPTTSTPKKASWWNSPKKSPEENEEPNGASSSVPRRQRNASLSPEPEENSYEMSNSLTEHRIQFNESPSVDLQAANSVPRQSITDTSGTKEMSDTEVSQVEETSMQNNLHNPLVITLSAAVVCLSLYIILLKNKN